MMLSVCMITYNHEKYIAQAIEGVLMQKTKFAFELIIGEDCSNDSTRIICNEYKEKYPGKIKLLLNEKNIGMMPNFIQTLKACKRKYIALCEGDDYWIDPNKLQKQVDFLENNPGYVISFHDSHLVEIGHVGNFNKTILDGNGISRTAKDIFLSKIIPTQTAVFKNFINNFPKGFYNVYNGDTYLFCLLSSINGESAYYHTDISPSVYRIHNIGNWTSLSWAKKYNHSLSTMFQLYNDFPIYRKEILFRIQQMQIEFGTKVKIIVFLSFSFRIIVFCLKKLEIGLSLLIGQRVLRRVFV